MPAPHRQPSTDRRDPAARAANLAWALHRDRLEREERRHRPATLGELEDVARRLECVEAALAQLAAVVDDLDDLARHLLERRDAA